MNSRQLVNKIRGSKYITNGSLDTQGSEKTEFEAFIPDFKPWNIDTPPDETISTDTFFMYLDANLALT